MEITMADRSDVPEKVVKRGRLCGLAPAHLIGLGITGRTADGLTTAQVSSLYALSILPAYAFHCTILRDSFKRLYHQAELLNHCI